MNRSKERSEGRRHDFLTLSFSSKGTLRKYFFMVSGLLKIESDKSSSEIC